MWVTDRERRPSRPLAGIALNTTHGDGYGVAVPVMLSASDPSDYLAGDDVIETDAPEVVALAESLARQHPDHAAFAEAAYLWVRDNVAHSWDAQDPRRTVTASDALRKRVGLCFVKSHLLTALLRARDIPAGLCYQRVGSPTDGYALHGLIAVHLGGAWHRQDPRGNNDRVNAQFSLTGEQLAWPIDADAGEVDYPTVYTSPIPVVLGALRGSDDMLALCASGLPDHIPA